MKISLIICTLLECVISFNAIARNVDFNSLFEQQTNATALTFNPTAITSSNVISRITMGGFFNSSDCSGTSYGSPPYHFATGSDSVGYTISVGTPFHLNVRALYQLGINSGATGNLDTSNSVKISFRNNSNNKFAYFGGIINACFAISCSSIAQTCQATTSSPNNFTFS